MKLGTQKWAYAQPCMGSDGGRCEGDHNPCLNKNLPAGQKISDESCGGFKGNLPGKDRYGDAGKIAICCAYVARARFRFRAGAALAQTNPTYVALPPPSPDPAGRSFTCIRMSDRRPLGRCRNHHDDVEHKVCGIITSAIQAATTWQDAC